MKAFITKYANTWGTNSTSPLPPTVKGKQREVDATRSHSAIDTGRQGDRNIFDSSTNATDTITKSQGSDVVRLSIARAKSDPVYEAPFVIVGSSKDERPTSQAKDDAANAHSTFIASRHHTDSHTLVVPERKQSMRAKSKDRRSQAAVKREESSNDNSTPKQDTVSAFGGSQKKEEIQSEPAFLESRSNSAPTSAHIQQGYETPASSSRASDIRSSNTKSWKQRDDLKIFASSTRSAESNSISADPSHSKEKPSQKYASSYTSPAANKPKSRDLASELNELAIAHNEGLLGEEEYRMLRQAAFHRMAASGGMEIPREDRFNTKASINHSVPSCPANGFATSPPASMASRRSSRSNVLSLFRKPSSIGQRTSADSTAKSSTGIVAPSIKSKSSKSGNLQAEISQARHARSMRSSASYSAKVATMSSSDDDHLSSQRKHHRGSSGISSSSGASANGVGISDGNALLADNYRGKSTSEIEAEIVVLEEESRRILEGFRSLQISTIGRYQLNFDQLRKVTVAVDGAYDMTGNADGNAQLAFESTKPETKNARKSKSFGTLKMVNSSNETQRRKRESSMASPPSSYRGVNSAFSPTKPHMPLGSISANGSHIQNDTEDDSEEMCKLQAELAEIAKRRKDVSKKYADRLASLKSTLRSAKIRQTLR